MAHAVKRNDFKHRSRVNLKCDTCGTMEVRCDIEDADIYEAGFRSHTCGPLSLQLANADVARMLRHMSGAGDE
ncbi:MAG: hypothetical protein ACXVGA_00490 [Mycobacteriaceae bacterium]